MNGGNSKNVTPKIEMSALDGSNRSIIISCDMCLPRAITVDHSASINSEGQLYWTDDELGEIWSAMLNGSERSILFGM